MNQESKQNPICEKCGNPISGSIQGCDGKLWKVTSKRVVKSRKYYGAPQEEEGCTGQTVCSHDVLRGPDGIWCTRVVTGQGVRLYRVEPIDDSSNQCKGDCGMCGKENNPSSDEIFDEEHSENVSPLKMEEGKPYEGDGWSPEDDVLYERATEQFRQMMLRKLHAHADKGDWKTMQVPYLLDRAEQELNEVRQAVSNGSSKQAVQDECADVANLLMMLADNYEGTPPMALYKPVGGKYHRGIHGVKGGYMHVDIYCVLEAFGVTCPALQHAIKKLLYAGLRGKGSLLQDLRDAHEAVERSISMAVHRVPDDEV